MKYRYVVKVTGGVTRRGNWAVSHEASSEEAQRNRLCTIDDNDNVIWEPGVIDATFETSDE